MNYYTDLLTWARNWMATAQETDDDEDGRALIQELVDAILDLQAELIVLGAA